MHGGWSIAYSRSLREACKAVAHFVDRAQHIHGDTTLPLSLDQQDAIEQKKQTPFQTKKLFEKETKKQQQQKLNFTDSPMHRDRRLFH